MDPVFATKRKIFLISNEFWKTKRDRSLTFGILTNNEWVKYAHKIIWQHYAPIASYGSFRNWLLDVELLLKKTIHFIAKFYVSVTSTLKNAKFQSYWKNETYFAILVPYFEKKYTRMKKYNKMIFFKNKMISLFKSSLKTKELFNFFLCNILCT